MADNSDFICSPCSCPRSPPPVKNNNEKGKNNYIHIAAFFPGNSTFSHSRIKARITRKKRNQRKQKELNQKFFNQFITREELIIKAFSELNQNNRLLVYWQLGAAISREEKKYSTQRGYYNYLISSLSEKINTSEKILDKIKFFYNTYKIAAMLSFKLTWEHYEILLDLKDDKTRLYYQEQAMEKSLSVQELHAIIQQKNIESQINEP
jgi:hypothetical protein